MRRLTAFLPVLIGILFFSAANLSAAPTPSSGTATSIGTDTTTQGNWQGTYGTVGYYIPSGPSVTPSDGSTFNAGAASLYTWGANVGGASALKTGGGNIASAWYNNLGLSSPSLTLDVIVPSGQSQTVALYLLDYDQKGRAESVSVTDASNNPLIGPTAVSGTNFANGEYLLYTISGEVHINITLVSGPNAVASGIFFGQNSSMPPPVAVGVYIKNLVVNVPAQTSQETFSMALPAGKYLLQAVALLGTVASVPPATLNATCSITTKNSPTGPYIGLAAGSAYLVGPNSADTPQASTSVSMMTTLTSTVPQTLIMLCQNAGTDGLTASVTLSALSVQSIQVQ